MVSTGVTRVLLCGLFACACEPSEETTVDATSPDAASAPDMPAGPMLPEGCGAFLEPGEDDQTALQTLLIEALENSTVCLSAGTFRLNLETSLTVDGVTVRGAGRELTTLDFSSQDAGANGMLIRGNGVTVEHLTVKNTPGDGLRADDVDGISFLDVAVIWEADESLENGAYGLYPVNSANVLIDGCLVRGARDAGIYVGQSHNIIVRNSEASGNVAGIEIENSTDAEVYENYAHDNAGGLLVFNLPELPVQDGARANVHHNRVENNNGINFGAAGTTVAAVPPGTGILIIASDDNEVHHNTITGHDSGALIVLSYITDLLGEYDDARFNAYPTGNWVHDNTFADNGAMAMGVLEVLPIPMPLPDLIWDGCLENEADAMDPLRRNCFSGNIDADFANIRFCDNLEDQVTDISTVECTHVPLMPIVL